MSLFENCSVLKALITDTMFSGEFLKEYEHARNYIIERLQAGATLFIAGNGGSASDAQHIAGELVCRFKKNRKPFRSIALTTDTSVLTSIANDFDFNEVFSRQLRGLAKIGDVFLAISTSGNSKNILNALSEANKLMVGTVLLSGRTGGAAKNIPADFSLLVPSEDTPRIQELHKVIYHSLCEDIENALA